MVTKSAKKSYKTHAKKSQCKSIKRSAVCKRTPGCKVTKKTAKKKSYCRKKKNTLRNFLNSFNILNLVNPKNYSQSKK